MPDDPHNHVPAVSVADVWGDVGEMACDSNGATIILPPRRLPPERVSSAPVGGNDKGIRIGFPVQKKPEQEDRQLDVRKIDGSVIRLSPEESVPPKMERHVVFHELEPRKKSGSEGKDWGRATQFSMRWIFGICAGIGVLLVASLLLLPLVNRSNAAGSPTGGLALVKDEVLPLDEGDAFSVLVGGQKEAVELFNRMMSAVVEDDLSPLVRDPETIIPLIRESGRTVLVARNWKPEKNITWDVQAVQGKPYGLLSGSMPDYSQFNAYFVATDGRMQLDWKASNAYGTASFEELEQNQGDPSEIRGTIVPAGLYSNVFPEDIYQCYQLVGPEAERAVWCYARRGEAVDEALSKLFQSEGILEASLTPQKVTVRLEHAPAEARANQWLIEELLNEQWVKL